MFYLKWVLCHNLFSFQIQWGHSYGFGTTWGWVINDRIFIYCILFTIHIDYFNATLSLLSSFTYWKQQPGFSSKSRLLRSTDIRKSYRFGTTWGWVNDGKVFICGWTIPLIPTAAEVAFCSWQSHYAARKLQIIMYLQGYNTHSVIKDHQSTPAWRGHNPLCHTESIQQHTALQKEEAPGAGSHMQYDGIDWRSSYKLISDLRNISIFHCLRWHSFMPR